MAKKVLFLDMDGVLVNWCEGAHKLHGKPYSNKHWPYARGPKGWDFYKEPKFDIAYGPLFEPMGFDFWANLNWMPDGQEILQICENVFKDDVYLLTAPHQAEGVIDGRREWIDRNMPKYRRKVLVGYCKNAIAMAAGENAVLLDDWDRNINDWSEAGGTAVVCPRPWNSQEHLSNEVITTLIYRLCGASL